MQGWVLALLQWPYPVLLLANGENALPKTGATLRSRASHHLKTLSARRRLEGSRPAELVLDALHSQKVFPSSWVMMIYFLGQIVTLTPQSKNIYLARLEASKWCICRQYS